MKPIEKYQNRYIFSIIYNGKLLVKYPFGLIVLIFSIYSITDLAIKTRYTRKRLTIKKTKERNKEII